MRFYLPLYNPSHRFSWNHQYFFTIKGELDNRILFRKLWKSLSNLSFETDLYRTSSPSTWTSRPAPSFGFSSKFWCSHLYRFHFWYLKKLKFFHEKLFNEPWIVFQIFCSAAFEQLVTSHSWKCCMYTRKINWHFYYIYFFIYMYIYKGGSATVISCSQTFLIIVLSLWEFFLVSSDSATKLQVKSKNVKILLPEFRFFHLTQDF